MISGYHISHFVTCWLGRGERERRRRREGEEDGLRGTLRGEGCEMRRRGMMKRFEMGGGGVVFGGWERGRRKGLKYERGKN